MSFQTRTADDRPLLIQTLEPGFSGTEIAPLFAEATDRLDRLTSPIFYALDVQATDVRFGDVVLAASLATDRDRPAFHHPNVIETLIITDSAAIQMAAQGLTTPTYGSAKVRVFDTLEDALVYCDTQIVDS